MKDNIISLRSQGKTYDEIVEILGCSKSTVSYHLQSSVRENYLARQRRTRRQEKIDIKVFFGGKCSLCGYSKCLAALDFHHLGESLKEGTIDKMFETRGKKAAYEEAKKCILVCANCHREIHYNQPASSIEP